VDDNSGTWNNVQFTQSFGRFGNALIVTLLKSLNNQTQIAVRVTYNTTSEARAMNWLT